nr:MAG TPA: hypothetical protein [Caudoviricetes sp.]
MQSSPYTHFPNTGKPTSNYHRVTPITITHSLN